MTEILDWHKIFFIFVDICPTYFQIIISVYSCFSTILRPHLVVTMSITSISDQYKTKRNFESKIVGLQSKFITEKNKYVYCE